jgi:hypothetical protein
MHAIDRLSGEPQPTPTPTGESAQAVAAQLLRLGDMVQAGLLSREEFDTLKATLLRGG